VDFRLENTREADRARKMEAEANRFAARLLMPPTRIRANLRSREPDLSDVVRLLASLTSARPRSRSYIDAHRETLALVVVRNGRIDQAYRPDDFPWIEPRIGHRLPWTIVDGHRLLPGQLTPMEECDPETWLGKSAARKVEVLSEQVLAQRDGWAMILLHAEMAETE
jgi:hypothetical protein